MHRFALLVLAGCGRIGFGLGSDGDDTPPTDGPITDGQVTDAPMSNTGLDSVAVGFDDAAGVTIASAPAAHESNRLLIAAIHWVGTSSAIINVTDTAGNLYTPLTRVDHPGGGSVQMWFANGTFLADEDNKVTATFALPVTKRRILVHEYPKVANRSGQGTGSGNGATATTPAVGATADSLVVVSCFTPASQATFTAGANYTLGANVQSDSQTEDRVFAAAGSASGAMAFTPAGNYVMAMAVFER